MNEKNKIVPEVNKEFKSKLKLIRKYDDILKRVEGLERKMKGLNSNDKEDKIMIRDLKTRINRMRKELQSIKKQIS